MLLLLWWFGDPQNVRATPEATAKTKNARSEDDGHLADASALVVVFSALNKHTQGRGGTAFACAPEVRLLLLLALAACRSTVQEMNTQARGVYLFVLLYWTQNIHWGSLEQGKTLVLLFVVATNNTVWALKNAHAAENTSCRNKNTCFNWRTVEFMGNMTPPVHQTKARTANCGLETTTINCQPNPAAHT